MNEYFWFIVCILISYLLGSIPFGLILVKLKTGQDVRSIHSGRTGGTNAMRAAGPLVGIGTGVLDALKAAIAVWLSKYILPDSTWLAVLAPVAAIIGHNYSIYLLSRDEDGKIRLHGGAGGAPCVGGSVGLWWPSVLFIVPIGFIVFYFIGYASLTTISFAVVATIIFSVLYVTSSYPWQYIFYGLISLLLLLWALRPNLIRLMNGTERLVGYRAKKQKPNADQQP